MDAHYLATVIKEWSIELGFIEAKISSITLSQSEADKVNEWLAQGYHGDMSFFEKHGDKRTDARYVLPEAKSVITVAMPYWQGNPQDSWQVLQEPNQAYISRYALGRDYHKVLRQRLKQLGEKIAAEIPGVICRPVVDSAPISEVAFSAQAGLGWRGKHSLLLQKDSGSLFFLGALLLNIDLPKDTPIASHCGRCQRCMDSCPTKAIIAPYTVDARRCISYLTIESKQIIPIEFRQALGNRIYGCDDCQLVCPFTRFAKSNQEADFIPRHGLDQVSLLSLLSWTEEQFQKKMAGSPIFRIGYLKWLSNIIIALGNATKSATISEEVAPFMTHADPLISEAAAWTLSQHE